MLFVEMRKVEEGFGLDREERIRIFVLEMFGLRVLLIFK